jgi:hypothetical protein
MNSVPLISTFNNPLESGIRAVGILTSAYPKSYDLQKLVIFDYLVVHTGDMGGPESLHAQLPLRSKELLVRRRLVEYGLLLMMSRNLIERKVDSTGFSYRAGELSETFLNSLTAPYLKALRDRAAWVVSKFGDMNDEALRATTRTFFDGWIEEFHTIQQSLGT